METLSDRTTVINLPCEAEEDDLLGRKVGEPLCPEIGKDKAWLEDFKKTFITEEGTRSWNALYQGRPVSVIGNMIHRKWWQFYSYADYLSGILRIDKMVMSVDASFKDNSKNDRVAIEVWGKADNRMYLLDLINENLNFPDTIRQIKVMKAKYPKIGAILIEDKANGTGIIQVLKHEVMGIIPVMPDKSKEARVQGVTFAIEAGNCFLPDDRDFTFEFIDQCSAFPNGKHDDMVDSMSQCLSRLIFTRDVRKLMREARKNDRTFNLMNRKKRNVLGKGDKINVI